MPPTTFTTCGERRWAARLGTITSSGFPLALSVADDGLAGGNLNHKLKFDLNFGLMLLGKVAGNSYFQPEIAV
jgi:hypothetical protein